jgi:Pyridoxamine 5''-phosphate oxidase.
MVELTEKDIAMLSGTNYATFVTVNPDGSPHATITWVDEADGHVLVNTAEGRIKHRNCAANPKVALTVMQDGDAYDWISITGTVVAFETGEHAEGTSTSSRTATTDTATPTRPARSARS